MRYGALAQLGERKVRNLEARGSIPLRSTIKAKSSSMGGFAFNMRVLGVRTPALKNKI